MPKTTNISQRLLEAIEKVKNGEGFANFSPNKDEFLSAYQLSPLLDIPREDINAAMGKMYKIGTTINTPDAQNRQVKRKAIYTN